jgi:hypothetical protein
MRREWLVALIVAKKTDARRLLGIAQDTKDNLVAGWAIFEALRHYDARKARELRNSYSYTRFMNMGALWVRYEFEPSQAIDHLTSNLSTRAMVQQIQDVHSPYPEWQRKAFAMSKGWDVIATSDAPEEWRELAQRARELIAKYK